MNGPETAREAIKFREYLNSPAGRRELARDKKRRSDSDRANGHSPECSLTKCAPDCKHRI